MKQLIIVCAIVVGTCSAYAQANAGGKWADNERTSGAAIEATADFGKTAIALRNHRLTFSGMPQLSKSAIVTISNSEGEMVRQGKVNTVDNVVDMQYLDKGTYYVKLLYKGVERKGFVVNL